MGVAATQMERRGIRTERGDMNREINFNNQQLRQLRARINKIKDWLNVNADIIKTSPPTLYEVFSEVLSRRGQLKNASQLLIFIKHNNLHELSDLHNKVGEMYKRQNGLREKLKPIERRLKVLTEHIKQAEYHREFKSVYEKYKQQKSNKQNDFREKHRREITLYEAADAYLKKHLNGRIEIPLKKWKSEIIRLTDEKDAIYGEYTSLKEETRQVEQIKRSVENILREDGREVNPINKRGIEL
jgi:predicted  nucleic acid-binding Zn-ribbon protein